MYFMSRFLSASDAESEIFPSDALMLSTKRLMSHYFGYHNTVMGQYRILLILKNTCKGMIISRRVNICLSQRRKHCLNLYSGLLIKFVTSRTGLILFLLFAFMQCIVRFAN